MHLPLHTFAAALVVVALAALAAEGQRDSTTPSTPAQSLPSEQASTTAGRLSKEAWQHRERQKQVRLFQLRQHIMNNIQLQRKPNVTGVMSADEIDRIQTQFNRSQGSDERWNNGDDDDDRKRFSVLRPTCPSTKDRRAMKVWFTPGKYRLHFHLDTQARGLPTRTKVKSAVLRLHRKDAISTKQNKPVVPRRQAADGAAGSRGNDLHSNKRNRPKLNLTIVEYMSPVKYNIPELRKTVKTISVRQNRSGWMTINVKSVVRQWYRRPKMNFGLEVELINERNENLDPRTFFDGYTCNIGSGSSFTDHDFQKSNSTSTGRVESLERSEDSTMYPNLEVVTIQVPRLHRKRTK